ncbi:MAG: hypothetical protein ACE5GB_04880 [Acidimicrobiales bacterium]
MTSTVTSTLRVLGLDRGRWARVGPAAFWPAAALAVGASALLALNRFGGLVVETPRAFARMTLVGVYGWLGLTLTVWLIGSRGRAQRDHDDPPWWSGSLQITLVAVGLAHLPLLVLGGVVLVSAGLFRILGPGLIVAIFVLSFWFPAALVTAARHTHRLSLRRAAAVVGMPYLLWLALVGRHLLGQIQHLL